MTDTIVSLAEVLGDWSSGYSKSDAHDGGGNDMERQVIALCVDRARPTLDCMLYRGQGISDDLAAKLLDGSSTRIEHSMRLFSSWTKDIVVAKAFVEDAAECNESAVLIAVHSSQLNVLVDLTEFEGMTREEEVLVLAGPLVVSPENILEAWEYDAETECSTMIHGPACDPGANRHFI